MSISISKTAKKAILTAFQIDQMADQIKGLNATVADFMLDLGRKSESVEKFNASLAQITDWVRSDEGKDAIKKAGYKVEMTKDGKDVRLPRAWTQAASDVRGTIKYGVDLKAKDAKGKPVVPTLSAARKLKKLAREQQQEAQDDGSGEGENVQQLRAILRKFNELASDLTEGQASAAVSQLEKLYQQLTSAPARGEQEKERTAASTH